MNSMYWKLKPLFDIYHSPRMSPIYSPVMSPIYSPVMSFVYHSPIHSPISQYVSDTPEVCIWCKGCRLIKCPKCIILRGIIKCNCDNGYIKCICTWR